MVSVHYHILHRVCVLSDCCFTANYAMPTEKENTMELWRGIPQLTKNHHALLPQAQCWLQYNRRKEGMSLAVYREEKIGLHAWSLSYSYYADGTAHFTCCFNFVFVSINNCNVLAPTISTHPLEMPIHCDIPSSQHSPLQSSWTYCHPHAFITLMVHTFQLVAQN